MIGPTTPLVRCLRLACAALVPAIAATLTTSRAAGAQSPLRHWTEAIDSRFAATQPVISYTIRVDSADLSGFGVEMRVRGARDTTLLGMVTHPEYDDKYWRFVRDIKLDGAAGRIARVDSSLWRVVAPGGSFVLRYRLALPQQTVAQREAWKPFLSPTGALIGGPHSFMYVVGQTLAPSYVTLDLPSSWTVATGLVPTSNPRIFYAASVLMLVESPILAGRLRDWRFDVDGVPHRVAYWPLPNAVPFDTAAIVSGVEKVARAAIALFGRAPYREFVYQVQDGAFGGLEHPTSVTLGAPSRNLGEDPAPFFGELAHEYFHTWNLMRIHPAEYSDVTYGPTRQSRGLWFSEGLSMFYSDLLRRRAGLPVGTPTRTAHLESIIGRYTASPGNARLSAERVSEAQYAADPSVLGDYGASTHVQGELIGAMLDLEIRHATGGRRSFDDVMRLMLERYAGEHGFTSRDVERAVEDVCGCNVTPFFDAHVVGGRPIVFDDYLRYIGLRADITRGPALGSDGRPVADLRAYPYDPGDGRGPRIALSDPASAWGRAGLHTGDRVIAMNGQPTPDEQSVRRSMRQLASGDTVRVEVEHAGTRKTVTVVMTPFDRPFVRLRDVASPTAEQRALRARWESGAP